MSVFTIQQLRSLCKGDVARLPSFIVHDAGGWHGEPMADSKGRIHLSDHQFLHGVAPYWPVKKIGRHAATSIEYRLDLEPHHLQGSDDKTGQVAKDQAGVRKLAGQDEHGRRQSERPFVPKWAADLPPLTFERRRKDEGQ